MKTYRENKIPIYFLKFEELREKPREKLLEVFSFMLGETDLTGTVIEKRIDEVLSLGHNATKVYATKSTDKKFNNIDKYTQKQKDQITTNLHDYCQFFGYFFKKEGATLGTNSSFDS